MGVVESLKAEMSEMKQALVTSTSDLEKMTSDRSAVQAKLDETSSNLLDARDALERTTTEVEQLGMTREKLSDEIERLRASLQKETNEKTELESSLASSKETSADLKTKLASSEGRAEKLSNSLDETASLLSETKEQLEKQGAELNRVMEAKVASEQRKEKELAELSSKEKGTADKLALALNKVSDLERQLRDESNTVSKLQNDMLVAEESSTSRMAAMREEAEANDAKSRALIADLEERVAMLEESNKRKDEVLQLSKRVLGKALAKTEERGFSPEEDQLSG